MTVLCYHAVDPVWAAPLSVTPEALEQQMGWVARARTVLPLREAVGRLDGSWRLPRGHAALTFDDGFASVYDHAFPILARHQLPATVFLVAETLTPEGRAVDWVDEPSARPLTTLTLEQVREMQAAGVDFQSHSYSHLDLTTLSYEECRADLRRSRELLSDLLHDDVAMLAYPRGRHDETVRRAAADAGYRQAFSLPEAPEGPTSLAIPRVGVWHRNGPFALRVKAARPYLPLRQGKAASAAARLTRTMAGTVRPKRGGN